MVFIGRFQVVAHKVMSLVTCIYLCFFLVSCAVSTRTQYEDNDGFLPESFFKSIKKNRTLKEVVVNNLGEPVERLRTENGDEIYSYAFTKARYKHYSLFFIARYNSVGRDERYYHVIFNDGRVKKYWWNNMAEVSPKGKVVSRWPNEGGTDYSLRVIKNAEPDKTNFVLTRTIRPMALRTTVESEQMAVSGDTDVSNNDARANEGLTVNKRTQMLSDDENVSTAESTSMVEETMRSSSPSVGVPVVDAVPTEGLFPDGKTNSP